MSISQTIKELSENASKATSKFALLGFDGFVDRIIKVVDQRSGPGEHYTAMTMIDQLGFRISAAAGESANIELYAQYEKLGGNGPIMANAILAAGLDVQYIGTLGNPIHPVFKEFAAQTKAISSIEPGITHALEFDDGKIMLGEMAHFAKFDYKSILEAMGEGAFKDALARADLFALVNWTMIPAMTAIFEDLLTKALPSLPPKDGGRTFFFDLADPAKRSKADLRGALFAIKRFQAHGRVVLGLNLAEARQVLSVLELSDPGNTPEDLKSIATILRNQLEIACVIVHPREGAACATREESQYVAGPFCKDPKISTGAGDHFNAGFSMAWTLGLSPVACLTVAVATSGQYVRTAQSPSIGDTLDFLLEWDAGEV